MPLKRMSGRTTRGMAGGAGGRYGDKEALCGWSTRLVVGDGPCPLQEKGRASSVSDRFVGAPRLLVLNLFGADLFSSSKGSLQGGASD